MRPHPRCPLLGRYPLFRITLGALNPVNVSARVTRKTAKQLVEPIVCNKLTPCDVEQSESFASGCHTLHMPFSDILAHPARLRDCILSFRVTPSRSTSASNPASLTLVQRPRLRDLMSLQCVPNEVSEASVIRTQPLKLTTCSFLHPFAGLRFRRQSRLRTQKS